MEDQKAQSVKELYSAARGPRASWHNVFSVTECCALTRPFRDKQNLWWQRWNDPVNNPDKLHTNVLKGWATRGVVRLCTVAVCMGYIMSERSHYATEGVGEFQWCLRASKRPEQQSKVPPHSSRPTTISVDDDSLNKTMILYISRYPSLAYNSTLMPQTNQ